jgi:CheY-like chemotaxis protein
MQTQDTIKVLLTSRDEASMSDFRAGLDKNRVQTAWEKSGSLALARITQENFDLVVADENLADMSGLEFCEKVISQNPMVNLAAVSSLSPADFHEASEGLGIMMQLPVRPGQKQAEKLLNQLTTIMSLARQTEFKFNQ